MPKLTSLGAYELNHFIPLSHQSPEIPLTFSMTTQLQDTPTIYELYEKSIALAGDLERLPVLRSVELLPNLNVNVGTALAASGQTIGKATFILCAGNAYDADNIIMQSPPVCVVQTAGKPILIQCSVSVWPFKGGKLLPSKVNLTCLVQTELVEAGAALPKGTFYVNAILEVDWVKITKQELDDYLKEYIFSQMP